MRSSRCQSNNLRTYAPDYGEITQVYNGIDMNINARMRNGLQLQAGTSTGQRVDRLLRRPRRAAGTDGRILDGERSAAVQSCEPVLPLRAGHDDAVHGGRLLHDPEDRRAGERHVPELDRASRWPPNWTVSSAIASQWLGRPLSGAAPNITINLLSPD